MNENQWPRSPTIRINGGTTIYYVDDLIIEEAIRIFTSGGQPSESIKRGAALLRKLRAYGPTT